jgi:hypothetical protein
MRMDLNKILNITLDANSKSQSGKWIPLSKDTGLPHQCQQIFFILVATTNILLLHNELHEHTFFLNRLKK